MRRLRGLILMVAIGIAPMVNAEGINRLKVGVLMKFDPQITTVGQAVEDILATTGYRLTSRTVNAAYSAKILARPLPPLAQNAGIVSIEQGLLLLIGEDNRLVVDHANKLVAFEVMPQGENK